MKAQLEKFLSMKTGGVTRLAKILGVITIAATFGIGYEAYITSRDAVLHNSYGSNLDLARTFRDYAISRHGEGEQGAVLNDLRSLWQGLDRSIEGGFLCVVDTKGTLTLHTAAPQREGVDVGGNTIHPDNPVTLRGLVEQKQDYVGPYLSSAGKRQIAAFSYVPSLQSVVSIHVPYEAIDAKVREASLPWLIGLLVIGGGLVPFSLWFLHCAYQVAQQKLRRTNEALSTEISERKKAEQELWQHRQQLEKLVADRTVALTAANEELESFSYSVSHDLRTPLRSIDGFSQMLLEECDRKLDDSEKDYLQRVRNGVQYMGELIDDLLKLSKVSRGTLARKTVDLSALAEATLTHLRASDPERKVDVCIAPGLSVNADATLLSAVLENLLGNAWKYTGKVDQAVIEIGEIERDGETVFYVKDNGAGFDMRYADKLFGAFQRLHMKDEFPGTGIGLATVHRIVLRHGGRIWAEAEPGKGATFFFTLPLFVRPQTRVWHRRIRFGLVLRGRRARPWVGVSRVG
jgi:signal transduction histidine kinase